MSLKIIVSYASAGSGHRRAAEAIYDCLRKNYPQLDTIVVDILEYADSSFANFYSRGYSFLVKHLQFIWAIIYHLTRFKPSSCFLKFICRLYCFRFINLLIKQQPGIVLSTHFLPADIVAYLKQKGKINSRAVTLVTDFGLHPLWVIGNCDDYIVGSQYTRNLLVGRGIKGDKIKILGIPISAEFSIKCQETRRREEFGALLVTGSFGFSLLEKAVDMLHLEANLVVVCGNNQRLYNRLARKRYAGLGLFGFTNQMPRLMAQADIIITKAGYLTIAEALAMKLPLVFIGSIPGQETENARILESCGCAITAKNLKALKDIIINLKGDPEKLASMRANIERFRNPDGAEEICRYVCSGSI